MKHEVIPFRGRLPRLTRDEDNEIIAYRGRPPRPVPPNGGWRELSWTPDLGPSAKV